MWEPFVLSDQLFCNLKTALKNLLKRKKKPQLGVSSSLGKNNHLSVLAPLCIVTELKIIS